jgi:hypothetical protein
MEYSKLGRRDEKMGYWGERERERERERCREKRVS